MRTETLIVGAGPAGLAVGACLRRAGRELAIVDREHEVGSAWRRHYERLHLHTVKRHSALPFRPFSADDPKYVPRARVVAYLEEYARAFELAPELGVNVERVAHAASARARRRRALRRHAVAQRRIQERRAVRGQARARHRHRQHRR